MPTRGERQVYNIMPSYCLKHLVQEMSDTNEPSLPTEWIKSS